MLSTTQTTFVLLCFVYCNRFPSYRLFVFKDLPHRFHANIIMTYSQKKYELKKKLFRKLLSMTFYDGRLFIINSFVRLLYTALPLHCTVHSVKLYQPYTVTVQWNSLLIVVMWNVLFSVIAEISFRYRIRLSRAHLYAVEQLGF